MRSQKSKNTQKMYKLLDEFISYMYDKRTGSDMTADSYYRDIDRFITYLTDHDITSLKKVSKEDVLIMSVCFVRARSPEARSPMRPMHET